MGTNTMMRGPFPMDVYRGIILRNSALGMRKLWDVFMNWRSCLGGVALGLTPCVRWSLGILQCTHVFLAWHILYHCAPI